MELKLFATVFATVFLAELGDKTQLATLLFAAEGENPAWVVFFAASSALVASSLLGVLAGSLLSEALDPRLLRWTAGAAFIVIGVWTLFRS